MTAKPSIPPGAAVLTIRAGTVTRRCVARGCDLILVVMSGRLDVSIGGAGTRTYRDGEIALCPPGQPWLVYPPETDVRLLAVAIPAGPETVLRELARIPRIDDGTLIALAADAGVELLLDHPNDTPEETP